LVLLNITLYETEALFSDLRAEWPDLLADSDADQIFLTYEWQTAWWEAYLPGQIWALVVRDDNGRCQGLAPWFLAAADGQRVVSAIGGLDVTDYLDVIIRRGAEEAVLAALAGWLSEHADAFDMIHLRNLPQDSHALARLPELLEAGGFAVGIEVEDVCPIVRLPDTFQDYVASLDKKNRHELRRKLRRAAGAVEWHIVGAEDDLDAAMDIFLKLMAASTPEKAQFLENAQNVAFFRRMARVMAEQGWLQLAFLTVQGEAAATYLNFDYGNRIMVYNSGLDSDSHGYLSPGIVLIARLVEHAIAARREVFDFLRGGESYKYDMGGQDTPVYRMEIRRSA
jgi:CelD/BcsL family acetyltransferase involved in cellulose biosynthesis